MNQGELTVTVVKLVLGGVAAFLAIMLWSKTRDIAWMCLVAGTITAYAGIVYDMLVAFGVFSASALYIAGIPAASLLFAAVPPLFYIAAFTLMVIRSRV